MQAEAVQPPEKWCLVGSVPLKHKRSLCLWEPQTLVFSASSCFSAFPVTWRHCPHFSKVSLFHLGKETPGGSDRSLVCTNKYLKAISEPQKGPSACLWLTLFLPSMGFSAGTGALQEWRWYLGSGFYYFPGLSLLWDSSWSLHRKFCLKLPLPMLLWSLNFNLWDGVPGAPAPVPMVFSSFLSPSVLSNTYLEVTSRDGGKF